MDKADEKIAAALAVDCRLPLKRIASRTRLSWEVVDYRIKKMQENGVIQGFYPTIDYGRLGAFVYRVYLKFGGLPKDLEKKLLNRLKEMRSVEWFCLCGGYWDAIFHLAAKNNAQFVRQVTPLYDELGEYVLRQHVGISTSEGVFPPAMLLDVPVSKRRLIEGVPEKSVDFDAADLKIISSVSDDARKTFQEIGREGGVEAGVARYRFKELCRKKVFTQFFTAFNYAVLGFERYKVFFSTKPNKTREVADYFTQVPNTYSCITMLGAWDAEVELFVKNSLELHEILQEAMRKLPSAIRSYETVTIFRDHFNKQDFSYLLK